MKLMTLVCGVSLLLMAPFAQAGEIKVKWFEPENYTDMKGADESDKRFQKRAFKQFDKHFAKLAKKLPEGVVLNLKVTNVNLAGDVRYNFNLHREIRLVKDVYWPSFEFEYQLSQNNELIEKGEAEIKDMSFMVRGNRMSRHESLRFEKRLFNEWFEEQVQTRVDKWQKQQDAVMSE